MQQEIGNTMLEILLRKGEVNFCQHWGFYVGSFCRCNEDGYCEMECTLSFDAELLKEPLGYKYVIYSPKVTKEDEYYEKLHPFIELLGPNDPNRCLWLSPQESCRFYGGTYVLIMNFKW